jgi:hypothetical protein
MRTRKLVRMVSVLALAGGFVGLGGCALAPGFKPGGPQRSSDEFTYQSTPWEPLTVTLLDRREEMPLWTVDVPIGSKVSLRFYTDRETSGTAMRPDIMRWEIYDDDKSRTRLTNAMAVPGAESRLLLVTLRDETPELPEEAPPPLPDLADPNRTWVPVQPRTFRGVPVQQPPQPDGAYYRSDD